MAEQRGIIKLKGKIGDLTFYKTKDGYAARESKGMEGDRIATEEAFRRTRENMAEFGRAIKASKFFRRTFLTLVKQFGDRHVANRLMGAFSKVIKADSINERGKRMVLDAETELLKDFEFNENAPLLTLANMKIETSIDRATGTCTITFPGYSAKDTISQPSGSTHYRFTGAAAALNFESETGVVSVTEGEYLLTSALEVLPNTVEIPIEPGSTDPIFLILAISIYQHVNGTYYPLNSSAYNGMSIVLVAGT